MSDLTICSMRNSKIIQRKHSHVRKLPHLCRESLPVRLILEPFQPCFQRFLGPVHVDDNDGFCRGNPIPSRSLSQKIEIVTRIILGLRIRLMLKQWPNQQSMYALRRAQCIARRYWHGTRTSRTLCYTGACWFRSCYIKLRPERLSNHFFRNYPFLGRATWQVPSSRLRLVSKCKVA